MELDFHHDYNPISQQNPVEARHLHMLQTILWLCKSEPDAKAPKNLAERSKTFKFQP